MKIYVKLFPIPGICEASREMEFSLNEGTPNELLICVQEETGTDPLPLDILMFLLNGRGLDMNESSRFHDGDRLWILPRIEGG